MKEFKWNKLNRIKELKQLRDVDVFAEEVSRMARQINQRFYRLEKRGIYNTTAQQYAVKDTRKEKPRYPSSINVLKDMTIEELYELAIDINNKIVSPTSTLRGLKKVENKRLDSSLAKLSEEGFDIEKKKFIKFLENGGGEILNNKFLSSDQIIEMWQNSLVQGLTTKEFIRSFKSMYNKQVKNSDFDYIATERHLRGIAKRKADRRKNRRERK